jgi:hypothetical protein
MGQFPSQEYQNELRGSGAQITAQSALFCGRESGREPKRSVAWLKPQGVLKVSEAAAEAEFTPAVLWSAVGPVQVNGPLPATAQAATANLIFGSSFVR